MPRYAGTRALARVSITILLAALAVFGVPRGASALDWCQKLWDVVDSSVPSAQRPAILSGTRSLWCGAYDPNWVQIGYGNLRYEILYVDTRSHAGDYTLSFTHSLSCELNYDYLFLVGGGDGAQDPIGDSRTVLDQVIASGASGNKRLLAQWTGSVQTGGTADTRGGPVYISGDPSGQPSVATTTLTISAQHRALYLVFTSDVLWSHEDGLWPWGAGVVLDDIATSDHGTIYAEQAASGVQDALGGNVLVGTAIAPVLSARQPGETYVSGAAVYDGDPFSIGISEAVVEAFQSGALIAETLSTTNGQFQIPVPPGGYDIRATHSGFYPLLKTGVTVGVECPAGVTCVMTQVAPWTQLTFAGAPSRYEHAAIYDPVRDRMVVFGGRDGSARRNDVWALGLGTGGTWMQLAPSGGPPEGRSEISAIYDPARDRMIVFGGLSQSGALLNDVWALSLSGTPAWSQLSPSGLAPPGRYAYSAVYDPVGDRVIIYGGSNGAPLSDVWALALAGTPAWSKLSPSGAAPARSDHTAIYDSVRQRMLVFGGFNAPGGNDTWALSLTGSPAWTQLNPSGEAMLASQQHVAVYDPGHDQMVTGVSWDTSIYSLHFPPSPRWTLLRYVPPLTAPLPRYEHSGIYDPMRNRLIIFGGTDGSTIFSETWALDLGPTDRPPVVTAPASHSVVEGSLLQFSVTAYDPDGDAISSLDATGTARDVGADFTPGAGNTTGAFSWTPSYGQAGNYPVTFTAANVLSGSATTTITVAPALVVTSPTGGELWETGPGSPSHTIAWSWSGPPVDGFWVYLEYSLDGGLTFQKSPILDPYVSGDQRDVTIHVPQPGLKPDHFNSPFARIVVSAGNVGSPKLASAAGSTIAVWARPSNHVLLNTEAPVFTLNPIPPCAGWSETDVAGYEVWWERDRLSDTRKPLPSPFDGAHSQIPAGTRYYYYPTATWNTMLPGVYTLHVRALRVSGGPPCDYPSEGFVRANLENVRAGSSPGTTEPVLLLHGIWASSEETFGCTLEDALASDGHAVWTLDYPNLGDIRFSAGAMEEALQRVRRSSVAQVVVLAHSMGGLVSRACIQALGRDAHNGNGIAYEGAVSTLVTLGTPHQGAQTKLLWKTVKAASFQLQYYEDANIFRLIYPMAVKQVDDEDAEQLWPALNSGYSVEIAAGVRHLFLQGINSVSTIPDNAPACDAIGSNVWRWVGMIEIENPNDGAVAARRAIPPSYGSADRRRCVSENHATLPRLSSDEYETYVGPYLRGELYLDDPAQQNCTPVVQRPTRTWIERQLWPSSPTALASRQLAVDAYRADEEIPSRIAGASIEVIPVGGGSLGVLARRSDVGGDVTLPALPPGVYQETISARGYLPRTINFTIDSAGDGANIGVTLEPDPTFSGPTSPSIAVSANGIAPDSNVVLSLGAVGATEMIVAEEPGFSGRSWQPFASALPFQFADGRGLKTVFAAFRNASTEISDTVSAVVSVMPDSMGTLVVSSDPSGAAIFVEGRFTGRTTPATIDSVLSGWHTVLVALPGYRVLDDPAITHVPYAGTATVGFNLTPAIPPPVPSPRPTAMHLVGTRFPIVRWGGGPDPDPGDFVSYRLRFAWDSLGARPASEIAGITDTTFAPQVPLRDSTGYWWSVEAIDSHGLSSGYATPGESIAVDVTSPQVTVLYPPEGGSVLLGQTYDLLWSASDWSGVDSLSALLSRDGGITFSELLFSGFPNAPPFAWTVGGPLSEDCRIRLLARDRAGNSAAAESRGGFRISTATGVTGDQALPRTYALYPNNPNPFNPSTQIRYDLPTAGQVALRVFDIAGRMVATLVTGPRSGGRHSVRWDGTGLSGNEVASGVYFVDLRVGTYHASRKLILAR